MAGNLGGICGENDNGTIANCCSSGTVTGNRYLGGVCGENNNGTIINSYSTETVTGDLYLGGICGTNKNSGNIINCYAAGKMTGDEKIGGICGENEYNNNSNIYNCFWDIETSCVDIGVGYPLDYPHIITIGKTTSGNESTKNIH